LRPQEPLHMKKINKIKQNKNIGKVKS